MANTKVYVNTSSSGGTTGSSNASGTAFPSFETAMAYAIVNKVAGDKWTIILSAPSGVEDSTSLNTITGLSTNATGYCHVRPNRGNEGGTVADQRHYGQANTGIYRYTGALRPIVAAQYVYITGVQIWPSGSGATCPRGVQVDVDNVKIERCIIRQNPGYVGAGTDNVNYGFIFGGSSSNSIICNNIIIGFNCVGAYGLPGVGVVTGGGAKFYNNTVIGNLRGFHENGGGCTIKNNLVAGNSIVDWNSGGWGYSTVTHNASSDASVPGTSARASQTFTFVNSGAVDYRISSSDTGAALHGTSAAGVADWTDVDGNQNGIIQDINEITRITWSIGASEPVGADEPTTISLDTPTTLNFYQKNGSNQADISISVTSDGDTQEVEARFNGGSWSSIGTTDSGGNLTGTLEDQDDAVGTLEVRFVDFPAVTDSVTNIGIGNVSGGATDPRRIIVGFLS